jgi:hypothetical protein
MLAHPRTEATGDWGRTATRHCSDCHGSADYYYWHYPYNMNWQWNSRSWRGYYYDPWWWNDYWYWRDDDGEPIDRDPPRYFGERRRPSDTPGLVPGETKAREGEGAPSTPGGTDIRRDKDSPKQEGNATPQYQERRERPEPEEKPKPKKKKEKAEEDN